MCFVKVKQHYLSLLFSSSVKFSTNSSIFRKKFAPFRRKCKTKPFEFYLFKNTTFFYSLLQQMCSCRYIMLSGKNPLIWQLHIPIISQPPSNSKLGQTPPNFSKLLQTPSKPYPHLSKPCLNTFKRVQTRPNASKRI